MVGQATLYEHTGKPLSSVCARAGADKVGPADHEQDKYATSLLPKQPGCGG